MPFETGKSPQYTAHDCNDDFFNPIPLQLAECLALGTGCDGAGGEWEASGMCELGRHWVPLDSSTLYVRQRLMEF